MALWYVSLNSTIWRALLIPSSRLSDFKTAMTGDNFFTRVNGSFHQLSLHSAAGYWFFWYSEASLFSTTHAAGLATIIRIPISPTLQFLLLAFYARSRTLQEGLFLFVNKGKCGRIWILQQKLIVDFFIDDDRFVQLHRPYRCQMIWTWRYRVLLGGCWLIFLACLRNVSGTTQELVSHKNISFTMALPPVAGSSQLLHGARALVASMNGCVIRTQFQELLL